MKTHLEPAALVDLTGSWRLQNVDGSVACAMSVPGDVHSALLAAGVIPDPYHGQNEEAVQWVGEAEWTLTRSFQVTADLLDAPSVYLHADTLDTLCEVTLNGAVVGVAANRFRRHRWEVKAFLHPGENGVALRFRSAPAETRARAAALPLPHPALDPRTENPALEPAAQTDVPRWLGLGNRVASGRGAGRTLPTRHANRADRARLHDAGV